MKILKRIFYGTAAIIMAFCAFIMLCAFNPDMTQSVAGILYGEEKKEDLPNLEPTQMAMESETTEELSDALPEEDDAAMQYDMTVPEELRQKSGFQPIEEERNEVTDVMASRLKSDLSVGETGENLDFNGETYPFYAMLDRYGKEIYCQIYANAVKCNATFAPIREVDVDVLEDAYEAVYNDHPEIFWLEPGYSCKFKKDGTCVEIALKFNETTDYLDQAKAAMQVALDSIVNDAKGLATDYDKVKYVHDELIKRVEYDESAKMNQSAYSALVGTRSVCAGYAKAFRYVMQKLEIPCYYCTGYSGEAHAWNIVKINGVYTNIDVTWDDTDPVTYDYFNKSDKDFASTHKRTGLSENLPACGSSTNN